MAYINRLVPNRIALVIGVLALVAAGHWMTDWSGHYLYGVSVGIVVTVLISDYYQSDESG